MRRRQQHKQEVALLSEIKQRQLKGTVCQSSVSASTPVDGAAIDNIVRTFLPPPRGGESTHEGQAHPVAIPEIPKPKMSDKLESGLLAITAATGVDHVNSSDLLVVILDESDVYMDKEKSEVLKYRLDECIMDYYLANKNDENNHNPPPTLASNPYLAHGGLTMEACDEFSLSWLDTTIKTLPGLWTGSSGYKLVRVQDLPVYFEGEVDGLCFKGSVVALRSYLAYSNRHVRIKTWPIHKFTINLQIYKIVFKIPVDQRESLEKKDYKLSYKLGTVDVKILEPGK